MDIVPLVKGEITFEQGVPPFTGATLYVRLENVSYADAASEVVAEYVQRDVAFDPKTTEVLSFEISGKAPDPRARYGVRVHIDIDGDEQVSRGDYVNSHSCPVITFGQPRKVSILVSQVK